MKTFLKISFVSILISTLITYFNIMSINFFEADIHNYSFKIIVFSFLLYNMLYFYRAYKYIFIEKPDYWTKSRKEIKAKEKVIYTLSEKIRMTLYFVLYVVMLVSLSIFIFKTGLSVINIVTSLGILFSLVDFIISFYKNI